MTFKDTLNSLTGHSVAMYSTWLYHKPTRVMFDCGEGVSLAMKDCIFQVESVFLTHGHYDHIGGLTGMLFSRSSCPRPECRGGNEDRDTLTVFYPKGCRAVENLRQFAEKTIRCKVNWVEVEPGDTFQVSKNQHVEAFKVEHTGGLCLGYKLVESRTKLKASLEGKTGQEIAAYAQEHGRDAVRDTYTHILLAYCGDCAPVRASSVAGAEVLVHEATFLDPHCRNKRTHSTAEEAIEVANYAGAKALILIHVSSRYPRKDIEGDVRKAARSVGYRKPLVVLVGHRWVAVP